LLPALWATASRTPGQGNLRGGRRGASYNHGMRARRFVCSTALAVLAGFVSLSPGAAGPADAAPPAPIGGGIFAQLRYVGRDPATGLPASVDDRFIAEVERGVERYGKDEVQPVPPPPAGPVDVERLQVPALGVDAPVARFGLDRFGRLDVPQDARTVGWNPAYSRLPGEGGATFLAAHVEFAGAPGVFNQLSSLHPGAYLSIVLTGGTVRLYRVTSVVDYALGAIDMGALLHGREGVESVTLMTCSGPANEGEYPLRTVVLAELVAD